MNRYKQRIILTAAAVLVPLTVACGSAGSGRADSGAAGVPSPRPVTGVDWRVHGLTTDGTTRPAPASARIRIGTDGRAAGNLGCNQFAARATVHGDRITIGDLRTTRMACDRARMDFERALARTLTTGTLTARVHDGKATLTDGDGDVVHLASDTPE